MLSRNEYCGDRRYYIQHKRQQQQNIWWQNINCANVICDALAHLYMCIYIYINTEAWRIWHNNIMIWMTLINDNGMIKCDLVDELSAETHTHTYAYSYSARWPRGVWMVEYYNKHEQQHHHHRRHDEPAKPNRTEWRSNQPCHQYRHNR